MALRSINHDPQKTFMLLINKFPKLVKIRNTRNQTLVYIIVEHNKVEFLCLLLEKIPDLINSRGENLSS